MAAAQPPVIRLTLFVPGAAELQRSGVGGEWLTNPGDGAFARSFSFGTVDPEGLKKIDAAPGALLVKLTDDLDKGRAKVHAVVKQLKASGALAVRIEQSKMGWPIDEWLDMVGSNDIRALHRCAVAILGDDKWVKSCGMHAFSLPDARVEVGPGDKPLVAQRLLGSLNMYQIDQAPLLVSGDTFAPDPETPRRLLQRWPDDGYPPGHWCSNPYGVWRLSLPGAKAATRLAQAQLFTPPLFVVLSALAMKQGSALTEEQVTDAVDEAEFVEIEHRDAQRLERERGFADLDPQLAWEQWKVLAATAARPAQ
ncbi:MAG: hypothetical protein IPJ65_05895 [Archangiaceae bacterium]|nr:hypothetical protein [Archangiaceae bacterium]